MSGNFSARTNSQTGFSAATRQSLPQHARLGTASSLTRPALPQSEPASGPSSIMIKGGWYKAQLPYGDDLVSGRQSAGRAAAGCSVISFGKCKLLISLVLPCLPEVLES